MNSRLSCIAYKLYITHIYVYIRAIYVRHTAYRLERVRGRDDN